MSAMRIPPVAALLFAVVGCTAVRPVSQPAQFIPQTNPDVVVVVYKDHSQVPVSDPRISGDTLIGTWLGVGEPVAVPLDQVERVEARQKDKKRTAFLIAGAAAGMAGAVWAFTLLTDGGNKACDLTYQPGTVREGRCVGEL